MFYLHGRKERQLPQERCTVNPLIGREMEGDEVQPAPAKKKVLVAGGGREVCTQLIQRQEEAIRSFSVKKRILWAES